jgi:hypothetical protein
MRSNSSGLDWDLRCLFCEKLVLFIQQNYPGAMPKTGFKSLG